MSDGTFVLHRFNGDEIYRLSKAIMFAYTGKDDVWLWFEVDAEAEPIRSLPDTAELGRDPHAEVAVIFQKLDLNNLVGRQFSIPAAYDKEVKERMATFYYCEHQELNNNKVEILSRKNQMFFVHWIGTTTDVNYYDGSKPETRVEIKGWFTFQEIEKWSGPNLA
jgi:hypothetical protein